MILSTFQGTTITDPQLYQSTVGSLQYLPLTRLDVAFAVNKVSQFIQNPRDTHWTAMKRILCFLKNTFDHALYIHKSSSTKLIAY